MEEFKVGDHTFIRTEHGLGVIINDQSKEDCYICKEIKENGRFYHYGGRGEYTDMTIEPGKQGRFRCFAYGEGVASIICNFCPCCGRQLNKPIIEGEK